VIEADTKTPRYRHPGEGRDPFSQRPGSGAALRIWIPAFAGMTKKNP
jgi:hypothetical protein